MRYKSTLTIAAILFFSLLSVILLYIGIDLVTDFLDESGFEVLSIISNGFLAVITFVGVRWFLAKYYLLQAQQLGFNGQQLLINFWKGVGVAVVLVLLIMLSAAIFTRHEWQFIAISGPLGVVSFVAANLVVAVWEEIYFRGFVFNVLLARKLSFRNAAFISSGLFTMVHAFAFDLETITPFWMFGVYFISTILLFLYVSTRSIWTPIGCHFAWDCFFVSIDPNENDFGLIEMGTYTRDAVLIDNCSIVVTGLLLLLLFAFSRTKLLTIKDSYLSQFYVNAGIEK